MHEGKTKRVEEREEKVILHFKDDITAGNGAKHDIIKGKGRICAEMTAILMRYLNEKGILTHFIDYEPPNKIIAKKLKMFPLEVVVRFKKAGSFIRRYGGNEGEELPEPLVEFFIKDDERHDPMVCRKHMIIMGIASEKDIEEMERSALKAAYLLRDFFLKGELELWDMKFEYGKGSDGKIYMGDEISPDTLRLRKKAGIYDKDIYRRDLGDPIKAYKEVLEICRAIASR